MSESVLSRCPRGHGRLVDERDRYGAWRSCLTCGFVQEQCSGPDLSWGDAKTAPARRRLPRHEQVSL
jgi:hypothetical protein